VKRVVVLAEPESLFLPHCVARLAQLHPVVAIVEVPPAPLKVTLKRAWRAFGPKVVGVTVASEAAARIVDRVSRDRFYSLEKVARRLGIPYEKVSDLHGADCFDALARHQPDVVFAQVTRRIRPELLERATFWNKHCSLLPGYAGVFPVYWALLHQRDELGVTIHEMDEEFDRGTILQQSAIAPDGHTFFAAYHKLFEETAPLLDRALRGDVLAPNGRPPARRSYYSFPTSADRAAFKRTGRRFGTPFRLHPRVVLQPAF
jgi:folate-dependent phosphoribosylglycinamide formyltransferase PurN